MIPDLGVMCCNFSSFPRQKATLALRIIMASLFASTLLLFLSSLTSSQGLLTRPNHISDLSFSRLTLLRGSREEISDHDLSVIGQASRFNQDTFALQHRTLQRSLLTVAAAATFCFSQLIFTPKAFAADGVQQGMSLFRNGDVKGSIQAFDTAVGKNPNLAAVMWQRGLSLYYAEQYAEGSKQFRYDIAANPSDAEEIIWTVMCDSKLQGFPTALQNMPLLPKIDRRPIMRAVYDMFRGKTGEKVLSDLGDKSGSRNSSGDYFYSRLYLSLYREAKGDTEASKQFMKDAVASYYGQASTDYMTSVAKVHLASR